MVVIRDAGSNKNLLYVDGQRDGSVAVSYIEGFDSPTAPINIGWLNRDGGHYFNGTLDEVAVYNEVLTDAEINQHFYDGAIGLRWGYCNCDSQIKIMPLGNSITHGYIAPAIDPEYRVGYRQKLYLDLTAMGYNIDFVGSQQAGQMVLPAFDNDNEGHPGWTAYEISVSIYDWLVNNPADVVLLHAGTNGLVSNPDDIEFTLDEIDRYSEDITVVLALIINQKEYNPLVTTFNDNVENMALDRIFNGDKIFIVDQENALTSELDFFDNLHPNLTGYKKMASVWAEALLGFMPLCSHLSPTIFSTPYIEANKNSHYLYDVNAGGNPLPTYTLLSGPNGMLLDELTGLISWTPDTEGDFEVIVSATNSQGEDSQAFTIHVRDIKTIDDDDAGASFTGSWSPSSGPDYYGSQSLYNRGVGTYTFQASVSDTADVYLWWTETSTRCDNVKVEIYDGTTLIDDTVRINQQENGGQWNLIGTYTFSGTAKVVIVSGSDTCSTCADAVQFVKAMPPVVLESIQIEGPLSVNRNSTSNYNVRAYYSDGYSQLVTADSWNVSCPTYASISAEGNLTTQNVSADQLCQISASYAEDGITKNFVLDITILYRLETIIDNGDAGTSFTGSWSPSNGPDYYGTQSLYNWNVGTYSFQASVFDTADVYLWWTETSSRCDNVTVEIYDGTTRIDDTVRINQQENGGQWNLIGTYTFSGTAKVVIVSGSDTCSTCADAVRFVKATTPVLDTVEIEGPVIVNDKASADYDLRAYYVGGSSRLVTADAWDIDCPAYGAISADGLLTTQDLLTDQPCQISASYSEDGITKNDILDITISDNSEVIVDNGDAGTSFTGSWSPSSGPDYYGSQSLYNWNVGTYSFQASVSETADVYLWWTETSSRCENVTVEIYDGTTLIDDTVRINQQENGGQWNLIGTYTFSGTAKVVIVSGSDTCSTCADAVRFLKTTTPVLDTVEIEGPVTVKDKASADYDLRAYYEGGSSRLVTADAWDIDCPAYGAISADGLLTTQDLLTDQPCQISASYSEDGITKNDILDITISDNSEVIVDDGDAGASFTGSWSPSNGPDYYGTQSLYNWNVGTYSFQASVFDTADVYLWWTETSSRCDNVTVEIYDGTTRIDDTVRINQQENGGQWNLIGTYTFSGTAKVVIVSGSDTCSTCADAVRFTD